jgi:uncharacterized damage-inducible protein DinB
MDTCIGYLFRYNQAANLRLVQALDALGPAELDKDRGSYYKSLHGLFNHIVGGELFGLKNLRKALPENPAFRIPALDVEMKPGAAPFPNYEDGKKALAALDAAFVSLASSLGPDELKVTAEVHGAIQSVSSLLSSGIAHAAHHRGQVAQILDEMGIENDFFMAIKDC